MRKALAIIIAPLTPAIIMIGLTVISTQSWPLNDTNYKIIITATVIVGYLGFMIFGIPVVHWLRKNNKLNITNLSLSGAIAGVIVFSPFSVLLGASLNSIVFMSITLGTASGLSVALTYSSISGITLRSKTTSQSSTA